MATYIPPEYQAELQQLQRRQQIAQSLMGQAFQQPPDNMSVPGGVVVKQNPLGYLLKALTVNKTNQTLGEGDQQLGNIQGQIAQNQQNQMAAMLAQAQKNPMQAANMGRTNADPRIAALAEQLAKDELKKRENIGGYQSTNGDVAGAIATQMQGAPENYSLPALPGPIFGVSPSGAPIAITKNRRGESTLQYEPKPNTITNTVTMGEKKFGYEQADKQIEVLQKDADLARKTIQANRMAQDALNKGAKAGGGEAFKQTLREVGQAFGFDAPGITETAELAMALGKHILAHARTLAPVTKEDIIRLEKIVGSIGTDPAALQEALGIMNAASYKGLNDYNQTVDDMAGALDDPNARKALLTRKRGFEPPPVPGNMVQQLATMDHLNQMGGDTSQFVTPPMTDMRTGQITPGQPIGVENGLPPRFELSREGLMPGPHPGAPKPAAPSNLPAPPPGAKWVK